MKRSKLNPAVIAIVGVFLGRGAQSQTTILTFDTGAANNTTITAPYGSAASSSGPGVTVSGGGTPNINLIWGGSGGATEWQSYNDAVWSAGQLNASLAGSFHNILFNPGLSTAVQLNSFNFHPYYVSAETFDYNWSVRSGPTVLANGSINLLSDATKNHPVTINYTGLPGQSLLLQIDRVGGSGDQFNIAVDDVSFTQAVPEPSSWALLSLGSLVAWGWVRRRRV